MVKIYKFNESFMKIGCPEDEAREIYEYFSFFVDGYQFMPKYKAGVWDGKIRLFNLQDRTMPIGLGKRLVKFLRDVKIPYEIIQSEKNYEKLGYLKEDVEYFSNEILQTPLTLKHYQTQGILTALRDNKCIIQSPTGSGKSLIIYTLAQILRHEYPDWKILITVPTVALVEQMKGDFLDYAKESPDQTEWLEKSIHRIYSKGDGKVLSEDSRIVIATWQSLQHIKNKKFFEQFQVLLSDEAHEAKAKEMTTINQNCSNALYKVGFTGTVQDETSIKMTLISLFGEIYKLVTTKQLIKEGTLTGIDIRTFILKYCKDDCRLVSKMNYHQENDFIRDKKERLKVILSLAMKCKGNTLILFKDIKNGYGKKIAKNLEKQGKEVFYIDGSTDSIYRNDIRAIVEKHDNAYIVASMGTFVRGINIKKLHNIIFAENSKSKVKILQGIGRSIRKHESKIQAIIIDIVDYLKFGKRKNFAFKHFEERLKVYESEGFPYRIKEIQF